MVHRLTDVPPKSEHDPLRYYVLKKVVSSGYSDKIRKLKKHIIIYFEISSVCKFNTMRNDFNAKKC